MSGLRGIAVSGGWVALFKGKEKDGEACLVAYPVVFWLQDGHELQGVIAAASGELGIVDYHPAFVRYAQVGDDGELLPTHRKFPASASDVTRSEREAKQKETDAA